MFFCVLYSIFYPVCLKKYEMKHQENEKGVENIGYEDDNKGDIG